ncbi:hypothetical protein ACPEEZ_04885 [Frigoribacterium sp. 2-23]|uniref:hypothetical protein n=1 Tax=Frigoribacterium sp. 2-23 TaxID=3415006 RepID=UPI003C70425B
MQWWNSFVEWVSSDQGWRIISSAIIPFVAIVVAGVIAASIGRAATKRVISHAEDEAKAAAVAGLITAARKAAIWSSLGTEERAYADHLAQEAEVRLRLLPAAGAGSAASWAEHELADIKRNSVTFSFQAEQSLADFRDRLVEWQNRPSKAKKLFRYDLERWKYEEADVDKGLDARQKAWDADRAAGKTTAATATPAPSSATASSPAPSSPFDRPTSPAAAPAEPRTVVPATTPARVDSPASSSSDPDSTSRDDRYRASLNATEAMPRVTPASASPAASPTPAPAPASAPSAADVDDDADEARYGDPVSAQQVRRRTSPDPTDEH